jgi:hypothetical protein
MGGDSLNEIIKQTKIWDIAGRILPISALGVLFMVDILNIIDLWDKIFIGLAIVFFTACVYWWWWSTYKIYQLSKFLVKTEEKIIDVNASLKSIHDDVKNLQKQD